MAQDPNYIDRFGSFPAGVDTNVPPRELPGQQAAFALNTSLRGRFPHTRPPVQFRTILDPDGVISGLAGLFQGAAYYRPDNAQESLFVSISGRLFQLTPDSSGNALLKERTIPGDTNDQLVTQCWMWQAENFLIVNDSKNLPLIFDGTTTRRSLGNQDQTVATTAAGFTAPAVGSDASVQITAPYTAPLSIPVTVDGKTYTVRSFSSDTGYLYTLKLKQTNKSVSAGSGHSCFLRTPNQYVSYFNQNIDVTNWENYVTNYFTNATINAWPPPASQLPIPAKYIKRITLSRPYNGALYGTLYINGKNKIGVVAIDATKMILDVVSLSSAYYDPYNLVGYGSFSSATIIV